RHPKPGLTIETITYTILHAVRTKRLCFGRRTMIALAQLLAVLALLVLLVRASGVSPLRLRGLTLPTHQPGACADWLSPGCIEQPTSRQRCALQPTTKVHPNYIQTASKLHPSTLSVEDHCGRLVTVI